MTKPTKAVVAIFALSLLFLAYLPIVLAQTSNTTLPWTINTTGTPWSGLIAFDISGSINATVVTYSNGTIQSIRQAPTEYSGSTYNIAKNTLLLEGEPGETKAYARWPGGPTLFWNLETNTVENFPRVISEHDVQFNPINNTFLTLQDYTKQIGNKLYLYDKMVQVYPNGSEIWMWDSFNYPQLSQPVSYFNDTTLLPPNNQTVIDPTHVNSIDWDYKNGVIYLNSRSLNAFYKINQTTGDIIWTCGENGNFTLLDENGTKVQNLWFHSHDTRQIAPDIFTMFDNDFENITNQNNCHSRLLEVKLNESTMTAQETWSWEAPTAYWNTYGGGCIKLPNGDYLGDFGDPTHQNVENQPWNFNNTGAVFVEVNPQGQVVNTITFPVGWYSYRVEDVTNITGTPQASPTAPELPNITVVAGSIMITTGVLSLIFYLRRKTCSSFV